MIQEKELLVEWLTYIKDLKSELFLWMRRQEEDARFFRISKKIKHQKSIGIPVY